MQKYRHMLRRRAILAIIDGLVVLLILLLVMVARNPVPTSRAISYIKTPGHILVQLAELPELAGSDISTGQELTLFGDGTLVFRTDPADDLWRAQLSPGTVQSILNVIINHDQFFAASATQYGSIIHSSDDELMLLAVDANGQQKQVMLASKPTTGDATDIQTTHVFAIEQFLLAYQPPHAVFYAPNSDPNDDGI